MLDTNQLQSTNDNKDNNIFLSSENTDTPYEYRLDEITQKIFNITQHSFPNCSISLYNINPKTKKIESTLANLDLWPIQENTIRWLTNHISSKKKLLPYIYIKNRESFILTDFLRLKLDTEKYNYNCNDGLFLNFKKNDGQIYAIIFIHQWHLKHPLKLPHLTLPSTIRLLATKIKPLTELIDDFYVRTTINSLLSTKESLKSRLNEDEISLKQKILELETMFETSSDLGHSLNYHEIIKKTSKSVRKVIKYNFFNVFLNDIFNSNELFITQSHNFSDSTLEGVIDDVINCSKLFFSTNFKKSDISIIFSKISYKVFSKDLNKIYSYTTLPLIFQGNIIGIVVISGLEEKSFDNSQLQYINTITNNLASTLGKIKIIRDLEKSKIYSVIEGIQEPILIIDEKHQVNILNPEAKKVLKASSKHVSATTLFILMEKIGLLSLFNRVKATKKAIINQEINYYQKNFIVNISPIITADHGYVGVIFLFRDVTQIQQMNRITTLRLNAISQVNNIINSIQKPNELLNLLMSFLLETTNCNMGSIQLKRNNMFITAIHNNFPEKIRKTYRFLNKKAISEIVRENKKPLLIDNYFSHDDLDKNIKVIIDLYICIPVMINNELIGIINLLRKYGTTTTPFTSEDFETLLKVSTIVATALHSSMLYNEKVEKEKIDQEIKLATKVHQNLLSKDLPLHSKMSFGVLNIPARKLGGDFYDIIKFNQNKIAIIIADIVGKGIPAGLYMAVLKSIINRYISKYKPPKTILTKLSDVVYQDPVIHTFIPFFLGVFDFKNNTFTYSNAGHEPAYILRNTNTFIKCTTTDLPIGSFKSQSFSEKTIELENDDLFFCFTDGLIDLLNDKKSDKKSEKIKRFFASHSDFPPQTICSKLENYLNSFSSSNEKKDDITTLVCKFYKTNHKISKLLINKEIISTSQLKDIKKIRAIIKDICCSAKYSEKTMFDVQLSVNEVQANIIEHSYLGDEEKTILFKFQAYIDKFVITIKDFGIKHQNDYLKNNSMSVDTSEGSGLGVFLIYSLMDEVNYESSNMFNKLTLVKYDLK